ncbi:hypothetical protein L6V77_25995 [Myxococcota bacterium]|nr:hypothetical protein [Myxococcota bacterium]
MSGYRSAAGRVAALVRSAWVSALLLPGLASATEDRGARIEFMTASTLYGAGVGTLAALEFDLNPRPAAWIAAGLGGGMLYGSYRLSNDLAFTTANVRYIETAGLWTGVDGALLAAALDVDASPVVWTGLGAAAVGAGVAFGTRGGVGASEGQLSLVNSGGVWGPAVGVLTGLTFHLGTGEHLFRDLLVLNLAGLGAGIGLAQVYDPTREQVLYLDGGMLAGGLCGGLVGAMTAVFVDAWEPITGLALVGMGVGGWLVVREYGFDRKGTRRSSATAEAGGGLSFFVPLAGGAF